MRHVTVVGERIIHELRGKPCIDLESVAPTRKGCAVTRSFAGRVDDLEMMQEAIAAHVTRLGEKLRRQGLATDHVTVFFHTSPHDRGPARSVSTTVDFPEASNDTLALVRAAKWGGRRIWKSGYRYAKAGLMTVDLVPLEASQRALIGALDRERDGRLMATLDACNAKHGRGTVFSTAAGVARQRKAWITKFDMKSPRYTTRLEKVSVVGAGRRATITEGDAQPKRNWESQPDIGRFAEIAYSVIMASGVGGLLPYLAERKSEGRSKSASVATYRECDMANFMLTMNGPDISKFDIPQGQTVRLVQWGGDRGGNRLMLGVVPANPSIDIAVLPEKLGAASTAFNLTGKSLEDNIRVAAMVKTTGVRYCKDLIVNVQGTPTKHGAYTVDLLYSLATTGEAKRVYSYSRIFNDRDALLRQNKTPGSYNCGTKAQNYGPEIFGKPLSTNYFSYYKPFTGRIKRQDLRFDPAAMAKAISRIRSFLDKGTPVRVWLAHDNLNSGGATSSTFDFTFTIGLKQATHFVTIFAYNDNKFLYLDPWSFGSTFAYDGGVYGAAKHEYIGEFTFNAARLEYGIQKSPATGGSMAYTVIAGP